MSRIARALTRFAGATLVGAAAVIAAPVPTAGAAEVTINLSCDAYPWSSGQVGSTPLASDQAQTTSVGALDGPAEVNAGAAFSVDSASVSVDIPATSPSPLGTVTVKEVKNIEVAVALTGAAAVGNPTLSGGDVLGASATRSGNTIRFTMPGTQNGSSNTTDPPGTRFFPGGSTFATPKVTIPLTAGAAGTAIGASVVSQEMDVIIDLNGVPIAVHLVCDPAANSLGTIQVAAPPPPGAPDAVADTASTMQGKPVTIDVLANDEPNPEIGFDPDSLAITAAPKNGTATVNADHTVTYAPQPAFSGNDSFTYELCSLAPEPEEPPAELDAAPEPACDTATVTVTVNPEIVPEATTTTTTTTPSTVPPTVGPTAEELPRSGSGTGVLALVGAGAVALGLLALRSSRRPVSTGR